MFLINAFSVQMVKDFPATVTFTEVEELPKEGLESAIGHKDLADVLGVAQNRTNIELKKGDTAYLAQLQGGRLPEGATVLPEGFTLYFYKVEVQ